MRLQALLLVLAFGCSYACSAAAAGRLTVHLDGLVSGGALPASVAYCRPDARTTVAPGLNRSLGVRWSAGPPGTRSYALVMVDPDVPRDLAAAAAPGATIPIDAPRRDFAHWLLVDIPTAQRALAPGADGAGQPKGGKPVGPTKHGVRGENDYGVLGKDGPHGGYDGPCPPANDARVHHYAVHVYAIDEPSLKLAGTFTLADVRTAIRGHVLAAGEAIATYTLNPSLRR